MSPCTGRPRPSAGTAFHSLVALASLLALPFGASRALKAPAHLRCEYDANPIGIDETAPRLSWQVTDDRRGAKQTAYQILVAGSLDDLRADRGTLWDSGKVRSDQSVWVTYEGTPLVSRERCYWKVRTWDQDGKPSSYSKPASWEMGLLDPDDWHAKWITLAEPAGGPTMGQWIWHPTERGANSHVYLRKTFELTGKVTRAELRMSVDNHATLFVNGTEIGRHDDWGTVASCNGPRPA
jgi:alpha-L-rhamnosidase